MEVARFRRAGVLLAENEVSLTHKGDRLFGFNVGAYEVQLFSEGDAKCTCKHTVYDNKNRRACAHVIAAHAFLLLRLLTPSEREAVSENVET